MRIPESFDRFSLLLAALAAMLVLGPALDGLTDPFEISALLFLALMISLARALNLHPVLLVTAVVLSTLGFVYETAVNLQLIAVERPVILVITPLAYLGFVVAAVIALLRVVMGQQTVTAATVRGGIAVYLMMAVLWSLLYEALSIFDPDAFSGAGWAGADPATLRGRFIYFSLTTLTTLGYGDIVPTTEFARNLTTLEAVAGQLYVAVFIARLVALRVANELRGRTSAEE